MQERFFYVDFIKSTACILVILFHVDMHSFYADPNADLLFGLKFLGINVGDIAVSLFIIVSGFGLGLTSQKSFSMKTYAKKRFLAIYPAFWFTYAIVAVLVLFYLKKTIGEGQSISKFILTITALDGFFLYKTSNFYLVGEWFTGYMVLTYVLFPFLFLYALKKPILSSIFILIMMILLHVEYSKYFDIWESINPLMRIFEFFFGISFAQKIKNNQFLRKVLTLFSILFICCANYLLKFIPYHFVMVFLGISFFVFISSLLDIIQVPKEIKELFSFLAKLSFLAFLIHHQIILYFYYKIDIAHQSTLIKFAIFITIITLSFLYAYVAAPLIKHIIFAINNLIKKHYHG